ncbi:BppU family phage baseplate upper protein [Staphylococcus hominis]
MADIYKTKEIETNINERGVNLGNVDVTLYTMDKGSAAFKVYLKREVDYANEKVYDPVNLYTTNMTPRIDIVAADGSVFANEPIDIVIPENGVIQYIVSDYVIRHAGKMDVYIYLENKSESVQVANFYFYIEEDGVARRLGKEITGGRLEDVVKNVMSGQLMELLSEDFREQLEREIKSFLQDHNKDFNLRFEDLTREEKDELMKNLTNQGLADFRIEDNSIFNEKLVDGTIQPEKTSFFDVNDNLFNADSIIQSKSIDIDGSIIDDKDRWLSDFIKVPYSKLMSITPGAYRIGVFDENKKFVVRLGATSSENLIDFKTRTNAYYIRLSGSIDPNKVMLNEGSVLSELTEKRTKINKKYLPSVEELNQDELAFLIKNIIKDHSITPVKTNFLKEQTTNNLLDLSRVLNYKTVDIDGTIVDDKDRWLTDYIYIDPTQKEQLNFPTGSYRIACYDENKEFINRRGVTNDNKILIEPTSKARFVRISGAKSLSVMMINKGNSLLPLETYKGDVIKMIEDIKVGLDNSIYFKKSNNLFNRRNSQEDKTLDTDGSIIDQENWVVSPKIEVEPSSTIAFTTDVTVKWAVFDSEGKLLSRSGKVAGQTSTLIVPKNASYILLSVVKTTLDRFIANYGTEPMPFEEFGYTLISTNEAPITISSDIVPTQSGGGTVVQGGTVVDLKNSKQILSETSKSYEAEQTEKIYSTTQNSQLDYIELSTNNVNAEIILTYIDEKGTNVKAGVSKPGVLETIPLTLQNIVEYGYPNVEYLYYDPKKASYKIALKNLNFSNGFELSVKNSGSSTINITTKIVGRYYV